MKIINKRINEIAPFGKFVQPFYISGLYYGPVNITDNNTTSTIPIDTMHTTYFMTSVELTIDFIGLRNAANSLSNVRIFIYRDDYENTGNYLPSVLMYESPNISLGNNVLYKGDAINFTFYPGIVYWVGMILQAGPLSFTAYGNGQSPNLGFPTGDTTSAYTVLTYSHTFTDPLPITLTQSSLTLDTRGMPVVSFRAA